MPRIKLWLDVPQYAPVEELTQLAATLTPYTTPLKGSIRYSFYIEIPETEAGRSIQLPDAELVKEDNEEAT